MAILNNKPQYWFQTKAFRIALIVIGAIAVIALVIFNEQITQLFHSLTSKANVQEETVQLDHNNFLPAGDQNPAGSFTTDAQGRLILTP